MGREDARHVVERHINNVLMLEEESTEGMGSAEIEIEVGGGRRGAPEARL